MDPPIPAHRTSEAETKDLHWAPNRELSLEWLTDGAGKVWAETTIAGKFDLPNWIILDQDGEGQEMEKSGNFFLPMRIESPELAQSIQLVSPRGEIREAQIRLKISPEEWERAKALALIPPSPDHFGIGLSTSMIAYQDNRVQPFQELALTLKGSYSRALKENVWEVGGSFYFTVLPIAGNQPSDARFLGVNARVTYWPPVPKDPWKLGIAAGAYYTTMLVNSGTFGFRNMAGPQVYPTLTRYLKKGRSLSSYLKYSPVSGAGFSLLGLDNNREIAVGISYNLSRSFARRPLSYMLDFANLGLKIGKVQISSTSVSLGMSLGL